MTVASPAADDPIVCAVRASLAAHDPDSVGLEFVVGISGGIDSTVLLYVLVQLGHRVVAGHVNYGLRGAESDADEALVHDHCRDLNVPLHVAAVDPRPAAVAWQTSLQDAARRQRYEFLIRLADAHSIGHIAVAHNSDDQAETVLMHLFRGTGLAGVAGIPFVRAASPGKSPTIIRPLLTCSREAIEQFARKSKLRWRDDSSNNSDAYLRSRLRKYVRPIVVEHLGASAWTGLSRSSEVIRRSLDESGHDIAATILRGSSNENRFSIQTLREAPAWVRDRVLLECLRCYAPEVERSEAHVIELVRLLDAQPGTSKVWGSTAVYRDRDWLVFGSVSTNPGATVSLESGHFCSVSQGVIRLDELASMPKILNPATGDVVFVDLDSVSNPVVRPWSAGDRFNPFGMEGSMLVSDALATAGIPPSKKANWPLVVDSTGMILWVVGIRQAEQTRIRQDTRRCGMLSFSRAC